MAKPFRERNPVRIGAVSLAVIVAPSIVGDRYVQLAPAYTGGPALESGAVLEVDRTATPLELDDIYGSLDRLVVALGPNGANKDGALTDLLERTAENFGGEGAQFRQTLTDLGTLSETLDNNKEELFGSAAQLENFVKTLADNDTTVREFNQSLASVSTMLSGEREELAQALENLSSALGEVTTFVRTNKETFGANIKGLNRVAKVLVKRRSELSETLVNAPIALNNLYHTYNPDSGTLDTNANLGMLTDQLQSDPALLLCTVLNQVDTGGNLCNLVEGILPRAPFGAGTGSSTVPSDPTLGGLVRVDR
jgi:phospholipid/cholesterol/gamma-HCH transport system substrate-binding protein